MTTIYEQAAIEFNRLYREADARVRNGQTGDAFYIRRRGDIALTSMRIVDMVVVPHGLPTIRKAVRS